MRLGSKKKGQTQYLMDLDRIVDLRRCFVVFFVRDMGEELVKSQHPVLIITKI